MAGFMSPAPAAASAVDSRQGWIVALASMGLCAIGLGASLCLMVTLKLIATELNWPRAAPSIAYAATMVGAGLGGVVMGAWSDRVGVGWTSVVGSLGIGTGLILASQAQEPWELAAPFGIFAGFLGIAALFSPLIANATRWFDRRRGIAVAVVACGQNIAGAIWPNVIQYMTEAHGWRTAFWTYGAFCLAAMLPLTLVVRARPPSTAPAAKRAPGEVRRVLGLDAAVLTFLLFIAQVFCCVAMATPFVHGPAHVSDLGHGMTNGARMLSVFLGTSVVSLLTLGFIADRIGGLRTLLAASTLQAAAILLFAFVHDLVDLYGVAVLFGLGFGGLVPSYAIVIREVFPAAEVGKRIAIVFMGGTCGMALGGWLAGLVFDHFGHYHPAFFMGFVVNLANIAIMLFLLPRWLAHRRATRAARLAPA